MANFNEYLVNFTAHQGLHRVWAPLHHDGKAPLVSIWIDPRMTAFECEHQQDGVGASGSSEDGVAEEIEDSQWWAPTSMLRGQASAGTIP